MRRDIDQCMGIDPTTGQPSGSSVLWPGAMTMLAGIDLLAKFLAGSDDTSPGKPGERYRNFLGKYFTNLSQSDRDVIYQLRNALLHSFGLYSKGNGKVYRFVLDCGCTGPIVSHMHPDRYGIDLCVLHQEFERAVVAYQNELESNKELQANFTAIFPNYGRINTYLIADA